MFLIIKVGHYSSKATAVLHDRYVVRFAYAMDREDASSKRVILVIVFSLPEKQGALGIKEVLSQLEVGCRNLAINYFSQL